MEDNEIKQETTDRETNAVGEQLAQVFRCVFRATTALDEGVSQRYDAAGQLRLVLERIHKMEQLNLHQVVDVLVDQLTVEEREWAHHTREDAYISLAKDAVRFLIESSCNDHAARGRASMRLKTLQASVEYLDGEIESIFERRRRDN